MLPFYVKDPRLREGDKCNKNEGDNVQNLRKTLAFARVTTQNKISQKNERDKTQYSARGKKQVRRGHDLFL